MYNEGLATKKSRIVLIGGGGHCLSVLDTVMRMHIFSQIVITDQNRPAGSEIHGCKVVGKDEILSELYADGFTQAFITIGSIKDTKKRQSVFAKAQALGFIFPNIVDPSATVSKTAKLGNGIFIGKNAVINSDAVIEDMTIVNTGAIIEHDCHIGRFAHIAVGGTVCGGSNIGSNVFVGANATVIQGVNIGMNSVIGAGSVVLRDVTENSKVFGSVGGVKRKPILFLSLLCHKQDTLYHDFGRRCFV